MRENLGAFSLSLPLCFCLFLTHSSPFVSCSPGLTMTRPSSSSIGLIFLLIGYSAAGPELDLQPRAVRSSVCQEHTNLHTRMDAVEKKVEDTVENLEVELAAILDAIEDPKWRPLLDNTEKTAVDILEDPAQRGQS